MEEPGGNQMEEPGTFLDTVITPIYKALKEVSFWLLKMQTCA